MKGQRRFQNRARKRRQGLAVDVVIGEGNQPAVPAAVMPPEHLFLDGQALHHVQDRLYVGDQSQALGSVVRVLIVEVLRLLAAEEAGGWQLPVVPGHDCLFGPGQGADGLRRRDLRSLVEDDHVEELRVRGNHLRHLKRRHHPAGPEPAQHLRRLVDQLPHRKVPAALHRLPSHQVPLLRILVHGRNGLLRGLTPYPGRIELQVLGVQAGKLVAGPVVGQADKAGQPGLLQAQLGPDALQPGRRNRVGGQLHRQVPSDRRDNLADAGRLKPSFQIPQPGQSASHLLLIHQQL